MNLRNFALVFFSVLAMSAHANETQTFDTAFGPFQVQNMGQGLSLESNYKISLGTKTIGTTERFLELKAYNLGVGSYTGGMHSVLLKGYPSGNACLEVYSVLRFKENYQYVSHSLDVCGGTTSIRRNNSIVIIEGLERDEVTPVKYVINSDIVTKNDKPFSTGYKFFD